MGAAAVIIADRRLAAGLLGQVARLARVGPHHIDTHLVLYTFAERPRHRIRRGRRGVCALDHVRVADRLLRSIS